MATKYGIISSKQVQSERITTLGVSEVNAGIMEATKIHSQQMEVLLSTVCQKVTDHQINFKIPGSETLQPIDEWGKPQPTYELGQYSVAFPIFMAATALGTNRVSRAKMTVAELNRQLDSKMRADVDWMRRHLMAAWFTNNTYTFTDDLWGALTIQPLALASDNVTYLRRNGTSSTDTHHIAQANAISDADNPFSTIYRELDEHPSNSGPYVAYIPSSNTDEVEALTDLIEPDDPSLIISENNTRLRIGLNPDISEYGQGPVLFGERYLGRVNGVHCIEWASLPDDYIPFQSIGAGPFMGWREEPEPELQGFFTEQDPGDGNQLVSRFIRRSGFGVMNRIAAGVLRVGNGTYAEPTGYTAPLGR
jgi:hypothetical protein